MVVWAWWSLWLVLATISSCPPADDVLRRLVFEQPVAGVHVIGLSEHVDFWDRLGWRDRFSSPQFTVRQGDYAVQAFRGNGAYTPPTCRILGAADVAGSRTTISE
ncbi:MAG: DUF1223 domain-containing protein [Planctomycetes bacterium]|nr:DUF1223 domain-containing protein [Planctomycetota bacterium]MBI3402254.1 DUF1223 domain-containing protein [Acidobacteriota bacterium]